jgi:hypothetical protein
MSAFLFLDWVFHHGVCRWNKNIFYVGHRIVMEVRRGIITVNHNSAMFVWFKLYMVLMQHVLSEQEAISQANRDTKEIIV